MSKSSIAAPDFYTLQVAPGGGIAVRGWNDPTIVSIHDKQHQAAAEARRLKLEGHATAHVEIPETVLFGAAQRAEIDGVSVADWISSLVEERVRNDELGDRVFRRQVEGRIHSIHH